MTQSYCNRSPETPSFQQNTLRRAEKQDRGWLHRRGTQQSLPLQGQALDS